MKHVRQRNARIAEELILFVYKYGAKDINLNIKDNNNETTISITATNIEITHETLETITRLLNIPRCTEMEEYYWNLAGETETDTEISLVGVMSDKVKIDSSSKTLKIEVTRKK